MFGALLVTLLMDQVIALNLLQVQQQVNLLQVQQHQVKVFQHQHHLTNITPILNLFQ